MIGTRKYAWMVALSVLALCCGAGARASGAAGAEDRVVFIDGSEKAMRIAAIDQDGKIRGASDDVVIDAGKVFEVNRSVAVEPKPAGRHEILPLAGGRLRVDNVLADGKHFIARWPGGTEVRLSLDDVQAVRLFTGVGDKWQGSRAAFERALRDKQRPADLLFVVSDGQPAVLPVALKSMTARQVVVEFKGNERSIDRDKIYGIVLTRLADQAAPNTHILRMRHGSELAGRVLGLADGKLSFLIGASGPQSLDWASVASVEMVSDKVVFLSDLQPSKVVVRTIVTNPSPWRADLSVGGNRLRIGSKRYARGIGVHARCLLSYPAGGAFSLFLADIGLDAETHGQGDCVFIVQGDDKELFRKRMRGTMPAEKVKLDITGVDIVTLLVEPGAQLDLADHANWACARFVKWKGP